jgi:hypothetical protein
MEQHDAIAHPDLLEDIRAFCEARGMALTRFGKDALNDPAFVANLMSGRECRRSTINRVRSFMASSSEAPVRAAE